jgi:hypothetical protein
VEIPEDVVRSAIRRGWVVGIFAAVLSVPLSMISGFVSGSCCCLMNFVGAVPPIAFPFVAAFIAAMLVDWSQVPRDLAVGLGAKIGLRSGFVAGILGAFLGWLSSAAMSLLWGLYVLVANATQDSGSVGNAIGGLIMTMVPGMALSLGVNVVAGLLGLLFGVVGGAIGALIRRQ